MRKPLSYCIGFGIACVILGFMIAAPADGPRQETLGRACWFGLIGGCTGMLVGAAIGLTQYVIEQAWEMVRWYRRQPPFEREPEELPPWQGR